jgi:hypothetical protein
MNPALAFSPILAKHRYSNDRVEVEMMLTANLSTTITSLIVCRINSSSLLSREGH